MMYFHPSYSRSPIEELLDRWETAAVAAAPQPDSAETQDTGPPQTLDSGSESGTPPPPSRALPDPVHLVDFLDEDDLIPECRGDNQKLIDYLTQPDIIMELVMFTTTSGIPHSTDPSADHSPPSEEEVRRGLKFPYMASEVLAAEVPRITSALVESAAAMDKFLAFATDADADAELVSASGSPSSAVDPYLAAHFGKVLTTLLRVAHHETVAHLWRVAPTFLPSLLSNMAVTPMAELLVRIGEGPDLATDTHNYGSSPPTNPSPETMAILAEFDLLDRVATYYERQLARLDVIDESQPFIEGISNAVNVILGITMRVIQMPLNKMEVPPSLNLYGRPEIVGRILDKSLEVAQKGRSTSPLILALHLCKELITSKSNVAPEALTYEEIAEVARYVLPNDKSSSQETASADQTMPSSQAGLIRIIPTEQLELDLTKRYQVLADILGADTPSTVTSNSTMLPNELVNTSGPISPPLGTARLKIAEFFVSCLRAGSAGALQELTRLRVPATLLELVLKYCWSSMLHSTVSSAVDEALHSGPDAVRDTWLAAGLVKVLVVAWQKNDARESNGGVRVGYMGHVIQLSVSLRAGLAAIPPEKQAEYGSPADLAAFAEICTSKLDQATQLESRVLGGERPDMPRDNGIDDDLEEPTEVFSMEGISESLEQPRESLADQRALIHSSGAIPSDDTTSRDPLVLDEDDEVVPLDLGDDPKGAPPLVGGGSPEMGPGQSAPTPFTHVDEETDSSEGEGYEAFDPTDASEKTSGKLPAANGMVPDGPVTVDEDIESDSSEDNSEDYEKFDGPGPTQGSSDSAKS